MRRLSNASLAATLVFFVGMVFLPSQAAAGGDEPNIEWQVVPEAEVTQFEYAVGDLKGKPALTFTVAVKNVADRALRYRLNIFLMDMDKAAGHLIPRKGDPPVVQPGETQTVKVPFIGTETESKDMLVVVKTLSP